MLRNESSEFDEGMCNYYNREIISQIISRVSRPDKTLLLIYLTLQNTESPITLLFSPSLALALHVFSTPKRGLVLITIG